MAGEDHRGRVPPWVRGASWLFFCVLVLSGLGSFVGGLVAAISGLVRTHFADAAAGLVGVLLGGALMSIAYFGRPQSLRSNSDA